MESVYSSICTVYDVLFQSGTRALRGRMHHVRRREVSHSTAYKLFTPALHSQILLELSAKPSSTNVTNLSHSEMNRTVII